MTTFTTRFTRVTSSYGFDEGLYDQLPIFSSQERVESTLTGGYEFADPTETHVIYSGPAVSAITKTHLSVPMEKVLENSRQEKIRQLEIIITDSEFEKPCQGLFEMLAEINPEALIDFIYFYDLSTVNLAYALKSMELIDRENGRAFRTSIAYLTHEKGYVREGAAYGLLVYKNTSFSNRAKEEISKAIAIEQYLSVKSALSSVLEYLD